MIRNSTSRLLKPDPREREKVRFARKRSDSDPHSWWLIEKRSSGTAYGPLVWPHKRGNVSSTFASVSTVFRPALLFFRFRCDLLAH